MADLLTDFNTGLITGYVDFIDEKRDFIHIYDSHSRHFVAIDSLIRPVVGQFVEFTPEIPKDGKFKKAVIHRIFLITAEGAESFGYRDAEVIATHPDRGYCSWRLVKEVFSPISGVENSSPSSPTSDDESKSVSKSYSDSNEKYLSLPWMTGYGAKSVSKSQSAENEGESGILPIFEIGVEEVSYTTGYMSYSIPILDVEEISEKIQKGTHLRIIVFLKRYKGIKQPHVVRAEVVSLTDF